jgi:TetR/AcrR family transcriptional regulator, regulator of cefoperazone and chloramphenicol sensitivity
MVKGAVPPGKTPKIRQATTVGYQKGEETKSRLLAVALTAFGEAGFASATTREIADAAGVSLPTLQYYFGNKEGLYVACAELIVERFRSHTLAPSKAARRALSEGVTPESARAHLKEVILNLARFLCVSAEAGSWAPFLDRELRDPGPAFETLFGQLWDPGVRLTSELIQRVQGKRADAALARVQAILLVSSVMAFQSGRQFAQRSMRWANMGEEQLAVVLAGISAQVDAIGHVPFRGAGPQPGKD